VGFVLLGVWLLGVAAALAFMMLQTHLWQRFAVLASNLLTGWWAWQYVQSISAGRLHWDGGAWFWTHFDADPVKKLSLMLDAQQFMLVRLQSQRGQVDWLWLHATQYPSAWWDVRRALVHSEKRQEWALN
jgi:hypothetical protein